MQIADIDGVAIRLDFAGWLGKARPLKRAATARRVQMADIDARLQALGGVEGDGAEGPGFVGDLGVAYGGHERGELWGAEEAGDGFGEVGVGGRIAGEPSADAREDGAEVPAVEIAEDVVGGFGELEDGNGAAGLEDALDFEEAGFVVG